MGDQGAPGTVNDELVSSVDFAPNVLNLAGLEIPPEMQGRAFLGEHLSPPRQYIHGARDRMDERYDIIRSVRTKQYRYVRNFEPLIPYYQFMNTPEQGATMKEIRRAEREETLSAAARNFSTGSKPVEELYDLDTDPHEIHNLAGLAEYRELLVQLRQECLRWQKDVGDLGLIPEAEIALRQEQAGSTYAILHGENSAEKVTRLVDIAARASDGEAALPDLLVALDSPDSAVRYWGATGVGNIGAAAVASSVELQPLLSDESPSVRIAAARALCRMGKLQPGLDQLEAELQSPFEWGRLAAAIVLDELDELARPALSALQNAKRNQPNKYIVRVANKAVNDLLQTQDEVP